MASGEIQVSPRTTMGTKNPYKPGTWESGDGYYSVQTKDNNNNAKGNSSVAEGSQTDAHGEASHAEGYMTSTGVNADYSHTEGYKTSTQGQASHAEGNNTVTNNQAEHAEGKYNKSNMGGTEATNTLSSIGIGNGSGSVPGGERRNAFEVMENGDVYIKGIGNYDGKNATETESKTLQEVLANCAGVDIIEVTSAAQNPELYRQAEADIAAGILPIVHYDNKYYQFKNTKVATVIFSCIDFEVVTTEKVYYEYLFEIVETGNITTSKNTVSGTSIPFMGLSDMAMVTEDPLVVTLTATQKTVFENMTKQIFMSLSFSNIFPSISLITSYTMKGGESWVGIGVDRFMYTITPNTDYTAVTIKRTSIEPAEFVESAEIENSILILNNNDGSTVKYGKIIDIVLEDGQKTSWTDFKLTVAQTKLITDNDPDLIRIDTTAETTYPDSYTANLIWTKANHMNTPNVYTYDAIQHYEDPYQFMTVTINATGNAGSFRMSEIPSQVLADWYIESDQIISPSPIQIQLDEYQFNSIDYSYVRLIKMSFDGLIGYPEINLLKKRDEDDNYYIYGVEKIDGVLNYIELSVDNSTQIATLNLQKLMTNPPVITPELSQIVSMVPLTIQLTDEQKAIIEDPTNSFITLDGKHLGQGVYTFLLAKFNDVEWQLTGFNTNACAPYQVFRLNAFGGTYQSDTGYLKADISGISLLEHDNETIIEENYKLRTVFPACPSDTDGDFVLTAHVSGGDVTYEWVQE